MRSRACWHSPRKISVFYDQESDQVFSNPTRPSFVAALSSSLGQEGHLCLNASRSNEWRLVLGTQLVVLTSPDLA